MMTTRDITHYALWASGQHVADFATECDARGHVAEHRLSGVTIVPVTRSPTPAELRAEIAWKYRRNDRQD